MLRYSHWGLPSQEILKGFLILEGQSEDYTEGQKVQVQPAIRGCARVLGCPTLAMRTGSISGGVEASSLAPQRPGKAVFGITEQMSLQAALLFVVLVT